MLPQTHPRLKARCIGPKTLSTRVDEQTARRIEKRARAAGIPKTELLRRLLDYYEANAAEVEEEIEI